MAAVVTISIDETLLQRIDAWRQGENRTRSNAIETLLSRKLDEYERKEEEDVKTDNA